MANVVATERAIGNEHQRQRESIGHSRVSSLYRDEAKLDREQRTNIRADYRKRETTARQLIKQTGGPSIELFAQSRVVDCLTFSSGARMKISGRKPRSARGPATFRRIEIYFCVQLFRASRTRYGE